MKLRLALPCLIIAVACHYSIEVAQRPEGEAQTPPDGGTADACVPLTCTSAPQPCGPFPDGCGGTYDCGACPVIPACANGSKDVAESDVDCGGPCKPCAVTGKCGATADCVATATCIRNVCLQGRWEARAAMPTRRSGAQAVALASGVIYVMGGYASGGSARNTVEVYSPATDSWSKGPSMLEKRASFTAVLAADGRIFAIGGTSSLADAGVSLTAEAFDPQTQTWSRLPNLPEGREEAASAALADGTVVVVGGMDWSADPQVTDSMATLSPGASAWKTLPSRMLNPRSGHELVQLPEGGLIAFGGFVDLSDLTERVETWSVQTPVWSSLPSMPTPRLDFAAVPGPGGTAYLLGGYDVRTLALHMDAYQPTTKAWTVLAGPTPRSDLAATTTLDGRIWTFGGVRESDASDLVEVLAP